MINALINTSMTENSDESTLFFHSIEDSSIEQRIRSIVQRGPPQ